jgi:hypothetical protein
MRKLKTILKKTHSNPEYHTKRQRKDELITEATMQAF